MGKPPLLPPHPSQPLLPLPALLELEPDRSTSLLLTLIALCRVLCYAGHITTKGPIQFPTVRWLTIIDLGLSIQPQQVTAESTESILLRALVPSIQTAVWSLLEAIIVGCRDHLLPFTTVIEDWFVQSLVFQVSTQLSCSQLRLAIYKTLGHWVSVRRDCDDRTVSAVVQWLLEDVVSGCLDVKQSSISCLQSIVQCVGPVLPISTAQLLLKTEIELLMSHQPGNACMTADLLGVLVDCILSGAPSLVPPLSVALNIFGYYRSQPSLTAICERGISVCALMQHPIVPPSHYSSDYLSSCVLLPDNKQTIPSAQKRQPVQQHQMAEPLPDHTNSRSTIVGTTASFALPKNPMEDLLPITPDKDACHIDIPSNESRDKHKDTDLLMPCPSMQHGNVPRDQSQGKSANEEGTHHLMDLVCEAITFKSSCDRCESVEDSDKELLGTFVDEPPDN